MTDPREYPVTVTPRPDGADLEIAASHYEDFLRDVLDLVARDPQIADDLFDLLYGDKPAHDPHMPDQPSRDDRLAVAIVAALPVASTTIRLHRQPLTVLADRLQRLTGGRVWLPKTRRAA